MKKLLLVLLALPFIGFGQCIYGDCENGCNAIAKYTTQNGGTVKYEGCFKNGKWEGEGKYYQDDKLIYDGDWVNGTRDGNGKYYENDELIYDGDWVNNKMNGNGQMYQNGRLYYKGAITAGVENGIGTYYHKNGEEYTVKWIDGKTGENIYDPNDIKGSILDKCEIPLINNFGNGYKIDITVDGIKKQYIYDTGASDFVINSSMEKELILQGKIKAEDYYPPKEYLIANGEIIEKRIVRLDNIKIGDYIVNNVFASITDSNDDRILLCGLGLLNKFSKEGRMGNTLILYR